MSWRATLLAVALMAGTAVVLFWIFQRQVTGPSPAFYLPPDIRPALEASLEDQRRLAALEPESEASYRQRFDELETTVGRLRILEHNRDRLVRRYELVLLSLLGLSVALATVALAVRHSSYAPRLERIRSALSQLAAGSGPVAIGDRKRDTLGRISRMIETTSHEIAHERRRMRALRNLSRWQDAAKRQAHEMRTPLSGARLTLDRLRGLISDSAQPEPPNLVATVDDLGFELDRLGHFTQEFGSFARLRPPELRRESLPELVREFVSTYESAWSNLELVVAGDEEATVVADRSQIRQVLANLCDNSSKALTDRAGRVQLEIDGSAPEPRLLVSDDGPGIPIEIRERLFEPYTTTREIGEGMGLGLAISLKILLDHGGDLELVDSSPRGTTFALSLPRASDA